MLITVLYICDVPQDKGATNLREFAGIPTKFLGFPATIPTKFPLLISRDFPFPAISRFPQIPAISRFSHPAISCNFPFLAFSQDLYFPQFPTNYRNP